MSKKYSNFLKYRKMLHEKQDLKTVKKEIDDGKINGNNDSSYNSNK